MRSDTIRCDPSHRTHRRRTLLKIITALDCRATSVASVVASHTHIVVFLHLMPQLVLSFAAVLLAVDFTCVPFSLSHSLLLPVSLSLSHFVASTFIFSFIGLRFCLVSCVVGGSVCFCVGISLNRSIWLILLTSFFRLLCSAAFYALHRLFCLDIMAFIYANVIYALSLSLTFK